MEDKKFSLASSDPTAKGAAAIVLGSLAFLVLVSRVFRDVPA